MMTIPFSCGYSEPRSFVIPTLVSRSSFVAKLPRVTTTAGSMNPSCRSRNGRHVSISIGCGSRLPGGRHFTTLAMYTWSRVSPIPSIRSSGADPLDRRTARPVCPPRHPGLRPRTPDRRGDHRRRTPPGCGSRPDGQRRQPSASCSSAANDGAREDRIGAHPDRRAARRPHGRSRRSARRARGALEHQHVTGLSGTARAARPGISSAMRRDSGRRRDQVGGPADDERRQGDGRQHAA